MPRELSHPEPVLPRHKKRGEPFVERYPDYPSWLNGSTWELDIATEIHEPLENFRASLHYQTQVFRLNLTTKTVTRTMEDGTTRKVLLIRAYE